MSAITEYSQLKPQEWLAATLVLNPKCHQSFITGVEWVLDAHELREPDEGAALGMTIFSASNSIGNPHGLGKTLGRITHAVRQGIIGPKGLHTTWPETLTVFVPRKCLRLITSIANTQDEAAIALILAAEHGIRDLRAGTDAANTVVEGFRAGLGCAR